MTRRLRIAGSWRALFLVLAVLGLLCRVCGQLAIAEEPLRYRRVFVPAEDLQQEIRGLLPLKREEFESRISRAQQMAEPASANAAARFSRAAYRARLQGAQLVGGTAELEVEGQPESPVFLPLGKCNLALSAARWKREPERPAALGQDQDGRFGCLVEEPDTLLWDWGLAGTLDASGAKSFALQLPPATVSVLWLDVAVDHALVVEGGIASFVDDGPEASPVAPDDSTARRTWLVEVGGSHAVKLTVTPQSSSGAAPPLIAVREQSNYTLLRSSLDLDSVLQIETFQPALPALTLRVDRPLEITRLRCGDETLQWTVSKTDEAATIVVVSAPTALSGQTYSLDIQATGSWSADSPARLPRIVALGAAYQEGRANVAAATELGLEARPLQGCWQSAVTPASAGRGNDQFQFRLHEAGAAIEIAANLAPAGLRELSGTQLVIDGTKVSAVMTSELSSLGGKYFAIEAQIARRWIVDAVEVEPAEALSDRTLTPEGPSRQLLRLHLERALQESRPLRVVIRARHRLPPANEPLAEDFYKLATFTDARASRRLAAVRTTEAGTQLALQGDQRLNRLEPLQLPEEEMKLFEAVPGPLLFVDDSGATGLTATLATTAAAFRVETELEARLSGRRALQTLNLQCRPDSAPVGEFVVRLSPRPSGAIDWKLAGDDPRELNVAPLATDGGVLPEGDGEAAYRIKLVPPRSAPFAIQAAWTSTAAGALPLSLVAVPDASAQSGLVTVRSLDGAAWFIDADDMESLPIAQHAAEDDGVLIGSYAYRPGSRASLRVQRAEPTAAGSALRLESLNVQSRFSIDGRGEHAALFRVRNYGAAQLNLRLPPAALDLRLVDQASGATSSVSRTLSGEVSIPLPRGKREITIELRYSSEPAAESWLPWARFEAPLPKADTPPLATAWSVALCPGLAASDRTDSEVGAESAPPAAASDNNRSPAAMLRRIAGLTLVSDGADPSKHRAAESGKLGWMTYEQELPTGPSGSIRVFRPNAIAGLGISLFLLTAMATLSLPSRARSWIWPTAIATLVLAISAPPAFATIPFAVALGLAAGGLGLMFGRQTVAARPDRAPLPLRRALLVLLACLLMVGGEHERALAQDPKPAAAPERVPLSVDHRVVIAMNDDQKPAGEYVYLSPEFYDRLHKLTDAESNPLPDWLLIATRYHFPRPPRLSGAAPSLDELEVRIDLMTFRAGVQVELPFRRDQISLLEARTRLDGAPVAVAWREDGAALLLAVESSGRHQLQLACGALLRKSGDAALLALDIPPSSQSTVTTPLSLEVQPKLETPAIAADAAGDVGSRHYWLGPVARLSARWPMNEPNPAATQLEVDQLAWWHLKPGSVLMRGKYRIRPIGGALDGVDLEVDPRLRLVPGSISPKSATIEVTPGARQLVRVVPAERIESEFVLTADWLWVGASGTGNVALPRVAVRGDRIVRSWTGVSVDSALALEGPAATSKNQIGTDDFLIAWSEPESPPELALNDLSETTAPGLVVLPAAPQPQATTSAYWSLDAQQASLLLEAHLSQVPTIRFRQELDLPPALKVQRIRLMAAGSPVPHRWCQRPDGTVVITLLAAPPGEQLLELEATLPRARNRPRLPLPVVGLEGADVTEAVVRIYRQPQVAAQLQGAPGWERIAEPEMGRHVLGRGRLIAALRRLSGGGAVSQPVVTLGPNQPEVTSRLVLRVAEHDGQWTAEADVELTALGGALDVLQLEVPAEWAGPFSITPAAEHRVVAVPGAANHLLITPQQAITGNFHLTIRSPLKTRASEPIRAPLVSVLDSRAEERIVVLAKSGKSSGMQWETRGLQAAAPSGLRLPEGWLAPDQEYYQVVASSFEATSISPNAVPQRPRLSLAQFEILTQGSRRLVGHARFYVEPPAAGELVLEMPAETRLIQVLQAGSNCPCHAAGLRQWRIATNTLGAPVHLEVIYEGALPLATGDGQLGLTAPRLAGLPVARTLWNLFDLQLGASTGGKSGLRQISPLEAAIVKAELLADELTRVAGLRPENLPPAVLADVYSDSQQEFQAAYSEAAARLGQPPRQAAELSARLSQARQTADNARRRMEQGGIVVTPGAVPTTAGGDRELDRTERVNRTILLSDGLRDRLVVQMPVKNSPGEDRWWSAAMVGMLLGGGWLLSRLAKVRDLAAAHAPAIFAAAGLAWWLLAPLSWLGWIGVGLAVWLALRSPGRRRDASPISRSLA